MPNPHSWHRISNARGQVARVIPQIAVWARPSGMDSGKRGNMDVSHLPLGIESLYCIQIMGVATALLARLSERSALQSWCHAMFFASLILMGVATVASLTVGPGMTLASGATLAVMAVAAVCEFRPAANFETF